MKVLVTGGAGLVGSECCKLLAEKVKKWLTDEKSVLFTIIILGLLLRAYHMDYPFTGYQALKEVKFAGMAQIFSETGDYFTPRDYTMGPQNNVFFPAWLVLISWNLFGKSEFSARLPFVLMGVLSIYLMYLLGKRLYNREVGLLSAFFMAVSPMIVYFGRNVQGEGPLVFFSILTIYLFLLFQNTGKNLYLYSFSISLLLAAMSKFTSLYLLFPLGLYYYSNRKKFRIGLFKGLLAILIPLIPTWVYVKYTETLAGRVYTLPGAITTLDNLLDIRSIIYRVIYLIGGTNPLILIFALPFLYLFLKKRGQSRESDYLVIYWLLGYLMCYVSIMNIATVGNNYYLISFIPPIILASAKSASLIKNKKFLYELIAVTLITSLISLAIIYDAQHPDKDAGQKIASIIHENETLYRIGNNPLCYYAAHFCYNENHFAWNEGNYTYLSISGRFYKDVIEPYPEKRAFLEDNFDLLYNITGKRNLLKGNNFELKQSPEYELIYIRKKP